jgi:hypothetical protein
MDDEPDIMYLQAEKCWLLAVDGEVVVVEPKWPAVFLTKADALEHAASQFPGRAAEAGKRFCCHRGTVRLYRPTA